VTSSNQGDPHPGDVARSAPSSIRPAPIRIFDTTLRDGEQSPGFTMNATQKILFAHALEVWKTLAST
jgi:2-isopropylmalate synthase